MKELLGLDRQMSPTSPSGRGRLHQSVYSDAAIARASVRFHRSVLLLTTALESELDVRAGPSAEVTAVNEWVCLTTEQGPAQMGR